MPKDMVLDRTMANPIPDMVPQVLDMVVLINLIIMRISLELTINQRLTQVPRGAAGYPPQPPTSYPEGRGNPGGYYAPPNSHGPASSQYPAHPGEPGYYGRQSTYNTDCIFLPSSPRRKETL
jgi:hypothetical protein